MTRITFYTKDQTFLGFRCIGHAGFARFGRNDLVCSAISILCINTVNAIDKLAGDAIDVRHNKEKGLISCRFKSKPSAEARLLLQSFELGVTDVLREYGSKYVQIRYEEV